MGGSGGIKMMSPQMEAILIWCQCRTRDYGVKIENFTSSWANGVAFCALIHYFFVCSRGVPNVQRNVDGATTVKLTWISPLWKPHSNSSHAQKGYTRPNL